MSTLIQFLVEHGAMLLGGATCLLLGGVIGVLAVRTPIHRQRAGEMTILAVLVWLIMACLPLPRPTSWFWPEQRTVPVLAEERFAGESRELDEESTNGLDSQHVGQPNNQRATTTARASVPYSGNNSSTALDSKTPSSSRMDRIRTHVAETSPEISSPAVASWEIGRLFAAAYLVGVCGCLVWLVLGRILLERLVQTASVAEEWLQELYSDLPFNHRTNRPRLLVSKRCQRACSFGLRRATIVLPQSLCEPNRASGLRHVLQHELAHVEQRDAWGRLLFNLALPILYFHPLFRFVRARTYFAAELIADDRATRISSREAYANELIGLVKEFAGRTRAPSGVAGVFNSPTQFYRRMEMLIQRGNHLATNCSWMSRSVGFAIFALVIVCFAGSMGLPPLRAKDRPSKSAADAAETKSEQQNPGESISAKDAAKKSNAASRTPGLKKEDLRYDGKSFAEWRKYLKTELKPEHRIEGFKAMAAFGRRGYGKEAARTIVELAREFDVKSRDTDSSVIQQAAKAQRRIGLKAVPVLVEALNHQSVYVRRFAANVLGSSPAPVRGTPWKDAKTSVPALRKIVSKKDEDEYVRLKCIDAVSKLDPHPHAESTIQAFLAALKDNNVRIRLRAIGKLHRSERHAVLVVPALSHALQDDEPEIRQNAANLLGTLGAKARSAQSALIQAMEDEHYFVRFYAIHAIGGIGADPKAMVSATIQMLKKKHRTQYPDTLDTALRLLQKLGPKSTDAVPTLIDLYPEVGRSNQRTQVISTLGAIGPGAKAALPLLSKLLQNEDARVRKAAAAALNKISK